MRINKQLLSYARLIHVYVSMALLSLMIFFAVTGITLNHPEWFEQHEAEVISRDFSLDKKLLAPSQQGELISFLARNQLLNGKRFTLERDQYELFISDKRPGFNLTLSIDLTSGEVFQEQTDYGLWAKLNDLHKGRNSGGLWRFIIDFSALMMILFSLSGLILALVQRRVNRTLSISLLSTLLVVLVYLFHV